MNQIKMIPFCVCIMGIFIMVYQLRGEQNINKGSFKINVGKTIGFPSRSLFKLAT